MPIYEYQCEACGEHVEVLQKVSDEPLTECPQCNQPTLSKLVSAAAFQLKGTGWYVTDFRDKGKPAAKDSASGDKGGEAGKTGEGARPEAKKAAGADKAAGSGGSSGGTA